MASNGRKCFTCIWKIENARYCWHKKGQCLHSPLFAVDEIENSTWRLSMFPRFNLGNTLENGSFVALFLEEMTNSNIEIDFEIAFLAQNGQILHSVSRRIKSKFIGVSYAKREEVFPAIKSACNPRNIMIVRCKIWKNVGEFTKNVQCTVRTRILIQKMSFKWNIEHFSLLSVNDRKKYDIKSLKDNKKLMSLCLFLSADQKINFIITPEDDRTKYFMLQLFVIDASGNTIEGLKDEIWHETPDKIKQHTLRITKKILTEKKNIYLPNDVLSVKCKCAVTFGMVREEVEGFTSDCNAFENEKFEDECSDNDGVFPVSKDVLNEILQSLLRHEDKSPLFKSFMMDNLHTMFNNSSLSDIKLRTSSQTYKAHMFILSARSPKFWGMFSGEMKQKINDCVEISDLDDDTLSRILRYVYKNEVEITEWSTAIKLYIGADKYQIFDLKKKCTDYLIHNLSFNNASEALETADQQGDKNLKACVQHYILKHAKPVMISKEWGKLMEKNLELASEVMHLKCINEGP